MDKINFQNGVTKVNADTFNTFQNNIYQMQNEIGVVVNPTEPTGDNRRKVWMQKGKNLFNKNDYLSYVWFNMEGTIYKTEDNHIITDFIKVKPNTQYTFSTNTSIYLNLRGYDINKNQTKIIFDAITQTITFTTRENTYFIRVGIGNGLNYLDNNIQIEQGPTATEYEAYVEPKMYVLNDNDVYEEFISKEDTLINYSTTEQKIGTWTDGKPLYRKIVSGTFGTVTQDKESTVEINLPNVNFVLVDKYWLNRISSNNAINQGPVENLIYLGYTSIYSSDSTVRFRTKQSLASNVTVYAIIIYTKTTD